MPSDFGGFIQLLCFKDSRLSRPRVGAMYYEVASWFSGIITARTEMVSRIRTKICSRIRTEMVPRIRTDIVSRIRTYQEMFYHVLRTVINGCEEVYTGSVG